MFDQIISYFCMRVVWIFSFNMIYESKLHAHAKMKKQVHVVHRLEK